ncbi:hypothetical protein PT974_08033 [Cladobotryum mycophilum]|uniref:Uncharacterized protein n=1 Tax=Cladobotryum mycophilum TaxID=491253 RepID=A0ABR0SCD9_9HYPO
MESTREDPDGHTGHEPDPADSGSMRPPTPAAAATGMPHGYPPTGMSHGYAPTGVDTAHAGSSGDDDDGVGTTGTYWVLKRR